MKKFVNLWIGDRVAEIEYFAKVPQSTQDKKTAGLSNEEINTLYFESEDFQIEVKGIRILKEQYEAKAEFLSSDDIYEISQALKELRGERMLATEYWS